MEPIETESNKRDHETWVRVTIPLTLAAILTGIAVLSRVILTFGTNEKFSTGLSMHSDWFAAGFERIFLESIPFLLLGALAAAVVEHLFSIDEIAAIYPNRLALGITAGLLTAILIPVGEGGSIILARALIKKGASIPSAVALMLAAPAVNIPSLAVGLGSDQPNAAFWLRTGFGLVFAIIFSLLVSLEDQPERVLNSHCLLQQDNQRNGFGEAPRVMKGSRLKEIGVTTAREFLEFVPIVIAAALVAAVLQMLIPASWMPPTQGGIGAVAGSAGLWAVLSAYGSLGDWLAIQRSTAPWPLTAQTAFLTLGILVDIKLVVLYTRVFRKKIILYLAVLALGTAGLASMIAGVFGSSL